MQKICLLMIIILLCVGCDHKIPEPESFTVEASERDWPKYSIRHFVEGRNLKIECMVPGASFHADGKNQVKIRLYMNNVMYDEYHTAAFIVKDIPAGHYNIKLEIIDNANQTTGLTTNFPVIIQ